MAEAGERGTLDDNHGLSRPGWRKPPGRIAHDHGDEQLQYTVHIRLAGILAG
jgi:hypothetical protein